MQVDVPAGGRAGRVSKAWTVLTVNPQREKLSRTDFRFDIQALRAVAVLLVVAYHAHLPGFHGGFFGVDVFFVISGFVITNVLLKERDRTEGTSLLDFYARRIRRILPAATVVIIVTIFATYHWLTFYYGAPTANDAKWVAAFLGNFRFAAQGNNYLAQYGPPSTLQQFWSLAVEEQFYLVWPLLFGSLALVLPRVQLRFKLAVGLCAVIAASLVWSINETHVNANYAFYSPFSRAWELALGAILAVAAPWMQDRAPVVGSACRAIGFAVLAGATWWITSSTAWPGWAVIVPVAATGLVIAGGTLRVSSGFDTVTMLRVVQWVGIISYSLYLVHWPILTIASIHSISKLSLQTNLELVGVSIAVAAVSYYVIERPIRRSHLLIQRRVLTYAMGLLLIGSTYGAIYWHLHNP
jgi:peptidoglycan/LPS O-acetylase OafA/YrhL